MVKKRSLLDEMEEDARPPEAPDASEDPTMARLVELGNELQDLRDELDSIKAKEKEVREKYDRLRLTVVPDLMRSVGIVVDDKGRFTNGRGGLISLRTDLYAGYNKDEEDKVFAWLRKNQMGDVIKETVHSSTFKSLIRELIAEGKKVPEFVRVHYETSATVRRS